MNAVIKRIGSSVPESIVVTRGPWHNFTKVWGWEILMRLKREE